MNDDLLNDLEANPLAAVAKFYADAIANNDRALDFVKDELGIHYDEATEKQFGYSDRTLGSTSRTVESNEAASFAIYS